MWPQLDPSDTHSGELSDSLFAALNRRDVSAVLSLLAEDVSYENLGSSTQLRGRSDVGRFYLEALAALPAEAVFVLEGAEGGGSAGGTDVGGGVLQAGVAWHLELGGVAAPLSRGVGVYWAHPSSGRLRRIVDAPEHTVKQAAPALSHWVPPLLRGLGPLVLPAARGVTRRGRFMRGLFCGGATAGPPGVL
ncbi:hypothetical protein TSOC_006897 [Tetrabaena socialis]|uniref:SnoaL-like domain-containing protein n=1 Tax=Tetrabaena socialis TaxID=47790 RepID=A0A2J8A2D1_9CHLO|nr:hypothetical protein TSOC_006897 [Tetrabaena socialis]|eukprot:PNH06679.1 hypothetical protein TSOC_006897 [Tetrabaena socialis]